MRIDKLLSPLIKVALSSVASSLTKIGETIDLGANRNNGVFPTANVAGWVVTLNGGASGGAATLTLEIVTSANADLSSPTVLATKTAIGLADTVKNQFFIPVPQTNDWKRYLGVRAAYGTAAFTGGTVSVEFTDHYRNYRAYPAN